MTESVLVEENTKLGLPSTNLSAFAESPTFHLYSYQGLSLWYLWSFGNSPYCIEIIGNFAYITESLSFVEKSKFETLIITPTEVGIVYLLF